MKPMKKESDLIIYSPSDLIRYNHGCKITREQGCRVEEAPTGHWRGRHVAPVVFGAARAFQITLIKVECCRDERFVQGAQSEPEELLR
jgi:hypothetical protein